MTSLANQPEGGCSCGHVRYRLKSDPLIVHGCHCSLCQTQTGSAFVINALIESDRVEILKGDIEVIETPSPSGSGQMIARCPKCRVAVWSNYNMFIPGDRVRFVRVGSLDNPNRCPPDVHIYTSTKLDWVILPEGDQVAEEFYEFGTTWSPESKARIKVVQETIAAEEANRG